VKLILSMPGWRTKAAPATLSAWQAKSEPEAPHFATLSRPSAGGGAQKAAQLIAEEASATGAVDLQVVRGVAAFAIDMSGLPTLARETPGGAHQPISAPRDAYESAPSWTLPDTKGLLSCA
jgi:hypothetical protein